MLSRRSIARLAAGLSASVVMAAQARARAAETRVSRREADQLAASISSELFDGDGLAQAVHEKPAVSTFARNLDRTLVLGGGGEYYVAWYCGFFHGLMERHVDLTAAEMVVGTSAGSYAGSSLLSGRFQQLTTEFSFFGHLPGLFANLAPVTAPNNSQKRAQEINFSIKDGSPESIRTIGHAALASNNRLNGDGVERLAWLLTGDSRSSWPTAKMFMTSSDCYTGERLVIHQDVASKNGIPLAHAAAASSSLPGVIGPTLLGERFCMDGGISKVWAHADLVAGSKRAIVITLTNGYQGSLLTGIPHDIYSELSALEVTGTKSMLIIAGTPPGVNLLDPKQIEPALRAGYERANVEAPRIKAFWA